MWEGGGGGKTNGTKAGFGAPQHTYFPIDAQIERVRGVESK
jgi:hypothetical protein